MLHYIKIKIEMQRFFGINLFYLLNRCIKFTNLVNNINEFQTEMEVPHMGKKDCKKDKKNSSKNCPKGNEQNNMKKQDEEK